jgi:hypothetical protein
LDLSFQGPEPSLDDVSTIPFLENAARYDVNMNDSLLTVSRRLIASLFYFELDYLPHIKRRTITCKGKILCFYRNEKDPSRLVEKLAADGVRFTVNGCLLPGRVPTFLDLDSSHFQRCISVETEADISITLRFRDGSESHISGSPFSVEAIAAAQGLSAYFGTPDRRKRAATAENAPKAKRRKTGGTSQV